MAKSATATRVMIKGSEGNEDYLVIARSNGYVLGIKALMQLGDSGAMYGFRLRMQKADADPENNVTDLPAKEKEVMVNTFKDIPWGKRSLTRFSTMYTCPSSFGYEFRKQLLDEAATKLDELVADIEKKIDPVKLINKADALAFMAEQYQRIVKMVEDHINQAKAESGDHGPGEVVDFPGKSSENDIE